VTRSLVKMWY